MINVHDTTHTVAHTNVHPDGLAEYVNTKAETTRTASTAQISTAGDLRALVRALDKFEAPDDAQLHIDDDRAGHPAGFRVTWTLSRTDDWPGRAENRAKTTPAN